MASVFFNSSYVPCGFLIVADGEDPYGKHTALIQLDWDYPSVASRMGWIPCKCGSTDGTVECKACHRKVGEMIMEAYGWILDREGESFEQLDEYLEHIE